MGVASIIEPFQGVASTIRDTLCPPPSRSSHKHERNKTANTTSSSTPNGTPALQQADIKRHGTIAAAAAGN